MPFLMYLVMLSNTLKNETNVVLYLMGDKYKLEIIDSGIGIPKKSNSIYSTLF
jgi:hypothetical protein